MFYGDLYGIPHSNVQPVEMIKTLLSLRKLKAYGRQHDYFDHKIRVHLENKKIVSASKKKNEDVLVKASVYEMKF